MLVQATSMADTRDVVTGPMFGVDARGIGLERLVAFYR